MARDRKRQTYQRRGKLSVVEMVERGMPLRAAVRAALAEKGETLADWARAVGHDRSTVTRLLSGAGVRYEDLRVVLSEAFNMPRPWLDEQIGALEK